MQLQQVASILHIDLSSTLGRFADNESLYCRFLKKLGGDPSFAALKSAMSEQNWLEIERQAHTLKGVSANLGLCALQNSCDALVKAMREHRLNQADELFAQLSAQYALAMDALSALD